MPDSAPFPHELFLVVLGLGMLTALVLALSGLKTDGNRTMFIIVAGLTALIAIVGVILAAFGPSGPGTDGNRTMPIIVAGLTALIAIVGVIFAAFGP